jgi:hypothetical protein
MSKLILFDFTCLGGHTFEELVPSETQTCDCPVCGSSSKRIISGTHADPRMGLTNDFPTAAAKWEKKQRQRAKVDNIDGPNLWMY